MHKEDRIQKLNLDGTEIKDGGITFEDLRPEQKNNSFLAGSGIVIYKKKDGKIELLLQKRSKKMATDPGKWDIHGGYRNYGESSIEAALREAKEEIGAILNPKKLRIGFRISFETDLVRELCDYYFYDITEDSQNFSFDDQEVEEVKWASFETFKQFPERLGLKPRLDRNDFRVLAILYLEKYGNLDK